jgi:thioesterase domain-containing protein
LNDEPKKPMHSNSPFQTHVRPDLAIKRRSTISRPMESDSATPFGEDEIRNSHSALQVGWDKLYKARSILEAEQAHLRDDRIVLQGEFDLIQQREQDVAARELRIQQMEYQMQLAIADAQAEKDNESALSKLTRAPFDMARSVFGQKK